MKNLRNNKHKTFKNYSLTIDLIFKYIFQLQIHYKLYQFLDQYQKIKVYNYTTRMSQFQKESSIVVNDSYRRVNFQMEQSKSKIQKYHNVGTLRAKISILCLSTFYFGYCLTYLSTLTTQTMIQTFGAQTQKSVIKGFLIGILTLGAALGAFCSPFFMRCFSRRNVILVFNVAALVFQGIIQYPNLSNLFVCRAFQGFFLGIFMAVVPIYINQLSPKDIVRTFGVFTQLFVMIGLIVSYGLGIIFIKAGVPNNIMWRLMFGFNIITISTLILCIVFNYIPESPNSLIINGKNQKAKQVIGMFIKKQYVEEVFNEKVLEVEHQKSSNHDDSKQKESLKYSIKAYLVGFQLPLMQQLTGINAIVTQIGSVVSAHNASFGFYTPFIINFVQFLATFGAIYFLRIFGRRPIILAGNLSLAILDIILGILFIYIEKSSTIFWIVFVVLMFYMACYNTTIGPTVWMYVPEIIPAKIVPFATVLNWLGASFCIIILPIINQSLGGFAVFFLFGGLSLITGIINIIFCKQIKGLSLKQICAVYQ